MVARVLAGPYRQASIARLGPKRGHTQHPHPVPDARRSIVVGGTAVVTSVSVDDLGGTGR